MNTAGTQTRETPLNWPSSLRPILTAALESSCPIFIWSAPELLSICNDAARDLLGDVWPAEVWNTLGPLLEGVLRTGRATTAENLPMERERDGYCAECYVTLACSPIRDESGNVTGIFAPAQDSTAQFTRERRVGTIRQLARTLRAGRANSHEDVCRLAGEVLAANPHDFPFASFYLFSGNANEALLAGGSPAAAWPFASFASLAEAEAMPIPHLPDIPRGAWPEPPREIFVYPLHSAGRRNGIAILGINPRRRFDEEYRLFLSQILTHVTGTFAEIDVSRRKEADAALRSREAVRQANRRRWRDLLMHLPAAVAALRGPDHIFEYFNAEYHRLLSRSAEETAGKSVRDVFPEAVRQGFIEMLDDVYRTGTPHAAKEALVQVEVPGAGTREVYANFAYLPTRDDAGRIDGVFVHAVNVTELVQARRSAEESQERFRQLAESMPQIVWSTTPDGVCDYVNGRWTEATGLDLAATQALVFRDIMVPEDAAVLDAAVAEGMRCGQPYSFECRFPFLDGTQPWHLVRAVPVRNAEGEIVRWLGSSTDIDQQKRAADALRFSEWRLRFTLETADLGWWETNLDTLVADCSPRHAAIFGHDYAGPGSWRDFMDHVVPEDREEVERICIPTLERGGELHFECRIRRANDGAIRWIWIDGKSVPDSFSGPRLLLGLSADITERKEAEIALAQANEDLRRANADLEQFGFSVSHDLQEPLRAVIIYSQLLVEQCAGRLDSGTLEILGFLQSGASRMELLIRDLLTYTQLRNVEEPEEADAASAMADTLANLKEAIEESGASVTHDPLPPVKIRTVHLRQLLQNLIGNALKYHGEEAPTVHVAAERQGSQWLFSVADSGIGIDAAYQERIFGLFKRLHAGSEYAGTGIGLAICKRIVESYGGRIWVQSEPRHGSTFYFTLPA